MRTKTNRLIAGLLSIMMVLSLLPASAFTVFAAESAKSITAYVSVSKDGKLVTGRDGKSVAEIPVTLTGKESYTLDDVLKAVHDSCYNGGSAAGYESYTHETYGLSLKKLWGDESGGFGYQVNRGTVSVLGLNHLISDGDYIDAYINQSVYPDNEAYAVFDKSTYKAVSGSEISLKLTQAGYDENWNTVFSNCEDAAITIDGKPATTIVDGKEVPVTTKNGSATFTIKELGTHVVSAVKTKSVNGNTVTAITAPVCIVTVTEAPRLKSLKIFKENNNPDNTCELSPSFDPQVTEYDLSLPDYATTVWTQTELADGTEGKAVCSYAYNSMLGNFNWSSSTSINTSGGYFGIVIYDKANQMSSEDIRYTINLSKHATLSDLSVDGVSTLAFNRDINEGYHYYVDGDKDGVDITAKAYKKAYTITIGGNKATGGEAYHLQYSWDENGRMEVPVTVSEGTNVEPYTYHLLLEKQPQNDVPYIMTQPKEADYIVGETTTELSVTASANGELSYQWYENTSDSTVGGTAIAGATVSSYAPASTAIGTKYYYCEVTNKGKTENYKAVSQTARVTVDPDPTPKAVLKNAGNAINGYDWDTGYVYHVGDTAEALKVEASSAAADVTLSYKWYSVSRPYNISGYSSVSGATDTDTYIPPTALNMANDSGKYYACRVSCTFKGKTYSSWAVTGKTYTSGEGETAKTYDVSGVYVFIKTNQAATPSITKQPVGASYISGDRMSSLSVSATRADGGKLSYQWYENTADSNEGGTAIEKATSSSYALGTASEGGTKYYYCVITNTLQGYTASVTSDSVAISVKTVQELVGDKLKGSGTQEDPYLIETAQDYQTVHDLVAEGVKFQGQYLKQTAENITLPDNWEPIGIAKTKKAFGGILDGDNKMITVPENGLPLLGYVVGAEVKNLNIYGKKIAGYGLVNNLEGVGLSGTAIIIDNVTLKSGSSTLKSGFIGTYLTTNTFAGCSATFVVNIRNCTIEENVVIGYDKDQTMIGSFAGRVHGTIDHCISKATVYGKDYVGGILGTRDNALGICKVTNCQFDGIVEASGEQAGGIVGGGHSDQTAPNGAKVNIQDCSSSAVVTGKDKVGGILGADTNVLQLWSEHSIKNNSFTGKITAADGTYTGGIIGYYASLNKYDNITGNYYSNDCGADRGIGFVQYVDTNCATHETASGAIYLNTADGGSGIAGITKTDHNRTDDPLGADAHKLCYTDSTSVVATELIVSGEYKTKYAIGDKLDLSGIVLTVAYSDGTSKTISTDAVTVTGFDSSKAGLQEVILEYKGLTAVIKVQVNHSEDEITVTVSILGDTRHDCETDGKLHTLADHNLETWVPAREYKVSANAVVLDVLNEIFAANGITASNPTGSYIESLTRNGITLKVADNHANAGWMFTVNGKYGDLAVNQQVMNDGDIIIFHYTDDYTKEFKPTDHTESEAVEKLIAAIDAIVTLDSESAILAAREAYEALTDEQKAQVTNYDVLVAAEKALAELKKTDEDEACASAVETLIAAIGSPITLNSESAILAAREAYNALTDLQKQLVDNYNELVTAENELHQLKQSSHDEIYKKAGDYLVEWSKEQIPTVASVGGEWMIIGLVRSGRNVPDGYYENVLNYVKENINEHEQLSRSRSTDNSRVILALTALGGDVTDVGGHNLLMGLTDLSYIKKQGINGLAWALIAFDSHDYEIPDNHNAAEQATREKLVAYILEAQLSDGGWSISGDTYDSDMTAMAIQALVPYYSTNKEVKAAVDQALQLLSKVQNADGSFSALQADGSYVPACESTAQVIVALTALGIDLETDSRFIKNGNSAVDALCGYAAEGGGFIHTAGGERDGMATEQGYCALAAYNRFKEGKTGLYDMSDVKINAINPGGEDHKPTTPPENSKPLQDPTASDVNASVNPSAKPDNNSSDGQTANTNRSNAIQSTKTGDSSHIVVYVGLLILSLSAVVVAAAAKNRKKEQA